MSHFRLLFVKWKPPHIYSVLSTEVLPCMPMILKVQLLSYSKYSCNRAPAGLPIASPGMLRTTKVDLQSSKCICCLTLTLFNLLFQSFWITGDTLLHWSDLKGTAKVTTRFYTINEHSDYNPNNILINFIATQSWKNLNACVICRLTLWCADWKQRTASNNHTAGGKKGRGRLLLQQSSFEARSISGRSRLASTHKVNKKHVGKIWDYQPYSVS